MLDLANFIEYFEYFEVDFACWDWGELMYFELKFEEFIVFIKVIGSIGCFNWYVLQVVIITITRIIKVDGRYFAKNVLVDL